MSTWLERFLLALLAVVGGATVLTNPWGLDVFQRSTLLVAIVALSLFTAHTIERQRLNSGLDTRRQVPAPSVPSDASAIRPASPPSHAPPPPGVAAEERKTPQIPSRAGKGSRAASLVEPQPSASSPDLIVDDFVVLDSTLRARMKLKNYGNVRAETLLRVESLLAGVSMLVTGERPAIVLIPAGATKTLDFGPLNPEDAAAITAGTKTFEILVEATFGAGHKGHGYRYRGRYDPSRGQFNLVEEKRW